MSLPGSIGATWVSLISTHKIWTRIEMLVVEVVSGVSLTRITKVDYGQNTLAYYMPNYKSTKIYCIDLWRVAKRLEQFIKVCLQPEVKGVLSAVDRRLSPSPSPTRSLLTPKISPSLRRRCLAFLCSAISSSV
jgi:hypothetical protein